MPRGNAEIAEGGSGRIDLNERLVAEKGTFYFSGITALVRLPLEQVRRDRAKGLNTGVFITGYPGSPLAGYDLQLNRASSVLADHDVIHFPASSEERAATALMGTQMLDSFPHEKFDGVVGLWYGKGPGADRSGDALKHGNFAGTSKNGAVVILSGEDHEASSSTMPFQQDHAFIAAAMPIVAPSTVEEIYTLGLHAIGLSRASRCWVALKLPTALCDSGSTFDVWGGSVQSPEKVVEPFSFDPDFTFFPGTTIGQERELHKGRHAEAIRYSRDNRLNYKFGASGRSRIGLVTTGKSFGDLKAVFRRLGIVREDLEQLGISVLVYGMPYPFDGELARDFSRDVEQIFVLEEKRDILETNLRAALHLWGVTTQVYGKSSLDGGELFPVEGGYDADLILKLIGSSLFSGTLFEEPFSLEISKMEKVARPIPRMRGRTPNFCSGCPHSVSTQLPQGSTAWGSPGCHSFASIIEEPRHIEAMTQYGGEGLPWIGLSPFTEQKHIYQNVGDGSLFHSSYPNIGMCVDAGVSMTFKILFNGAIANTGGQHPVGQQSVTSLVRRLLDDGVVGVALVTKSSDRYKNARFGPRVEICAPDEIIRVQKSLSETEGVTVLLYDESCANERRRQQKRGLLPTSSRYVMINDRVCEACGDCGTKSNCMSLIQVPTKLGPKTQIHPSSCNQDESCLRGDCPSFVTVEVKPGTGYNRPEPREVPDGLLADPDFPLPGKLGYSIYIPGLGGTGVITANAILATAASIDGLGVATYDQTGAAQKWGPVLSSLVLGPREADLANAKVGVGSADVFVALDLVAAVDPKNLARCNDEFTLAVVNTDAMDTGEIVRNRKLSLDESAMISLIRSRTADKRFVPVPARRIAESIIGDYLLTNMVVIGAAYQSGAVPISSKAIEAAITANGVSIAENLLAFRWGRAWVADSSVVKRLLEMEEGLVSTEPFARIPPFRYRKVMSIISQKPSLSELPDELFIAIKERACDLVSYQNLKLAEAYISSVAAVCERESNVFPASFSITKVVAAQLYKLMAYKDEYEVARLYLSESFEKQVAATFEAPVRVTYHLHPPLLRSLGMRQKMALGPWFKGLLRILRAARFLRSTRLDPFSHSQLRREESETPKWYSDLVATALENLNSTNIGLVTQIVSLPEDIRGYEEIKHASLRQARRKGDELLGELGRAAN